MVIVLLVIVLQQLTHGAKGYVALGTMIREVRHPTTAAVAIHEHRRVTHKGPHGRLMRGELEDLLPGVVRAAAAPAIPALDMLDGVRTGSKAGVPAHGTRHSPGTMDLGVHVQLVLVIKYPIAHRALENGSGGQSGLVAVVVAVAIHTNLAPAVSVALPPLVPAELAAAAPVAATGTSSTHCILLTPELFRCSVVPNTISILYSMID